MTRRPNVPKPKAVKGKRPPVEVTFHPFSDSRALVTVYASSPPLKIPKGAIVRVIQDVDTTDANLRSVEKIAKVAEAQIEISPRPKHIVVTTPGDAQTAREVAIELARQTAFKREMPEIVTAVEEALSAAGL